DYLFAGTDPHVLEDQTKYVSEGLETILTQPITGKGASSIARQIKEETSNSIKLEDLIKLVSHVQPSFKELDSPKDDPIIVVDDSDEDKDDKVHATENSQKHKLKLEKNKAKAEAVILKAQPSFPNVEQLKNLLVNFLKMEFSNILFSRDFSSSLPIELKDLTSKFDSLTKEVKELKKHVHELEIELPKDLKEIPTKLEEFTKTGEHIKEDKGKKALSSNEAEKESTDSDSADATHVTGSMVEPSRTKKLIFHKNQGSKYISQKPRK
nr:hypothetical protein [Tanacetum cinerariifolium]